MPVLPVGDPDQGEQVRSLHRRRAGCARGRARRRRARRREPAMSETQATRAATGEAEKAADKPRTKWDKIITSTPVVMTIVATVLAGLSTSEMNQAQYFRATAAQQQSKASDQWALFQAKRGRASDAEQRA